MIATRIIRLGMVALAALSTSCAATRQVPVHELGAATSEPGARQRITGYTTTTGVSHVFDGYLETRVDSLRFVPARPDTGLEEASPGRDVSVPRDSVASVTMRKTDVPRSILLGAILLGAVVLIAGASTGSDGGGYP